MHTFSAGIYMYVFVYNDCCRYVYVGIYMNMYACICMRVLYMYVNIYVCVYICLNSSNHGLSDEMSKVAMHTFLAGIYVYSSDCFLHMYLHLYSSAYDIPQKKSVWIYILYI